MALASQLESKIRIQASATFNLYTTTNETTPRQADSCAGCCSPECLHVVHRCCRGKVVPIRQRLPMSRAIASSAVGGAQEVDSRCKLLRVPVSHIARKENNPTYQFWHVRRGYKRRIGCRQSPLAKYQSNSASFATADLPRPCAWPLEQQSPRALLKPRVVRRSVVVAHRCPRSA